jgi:hypothetical protein
MGAATGCRARGSGAGTGRSARGTPRRLAPIATEGRPVCRYPNDRSLLAPSNTSGVWTVDVVCVTTLYNRPRSVRASVASAFIEPRAPNTHLPGSQALNTLRIAVVIFMLAVGCGACDTKEREASRASIQQSPEDTSEAGDFRGHTWGDSFSNALETEAERSKRIGNSRSFQTEVAGYPAILELGEMEGGILAGAGYVFPWPGESAHCQTVVQIGSRCSVDSASYAVEVCNRLAGILSQKYRLLGKADGMVESRVPQFGTELEKELTRPDQGFDLMLKQWTGSRAQVFLSFPRPRQPGQGWRCSITYRPPPDLAGILIDAERRAVDEKARQDL